MEKVFLNGQIVSATKAAVAVTDSSYLYGIDLLLFVLGLLVGYLPVHDYFVNPDHHVEYAPLAILAARLDLKKCRQLRKNISHLTPEGLSAFYSDYPCIQKEADNSSRCLMEVLRV